MDFGIAVIIPTWNGKSLLSGCLEALRDQERTPERIVVVDNGSTDGTVEYLREFWPDVERLTLARNEGFAAAVQRGVESVQEPLIALLNNDAQPHAAWLLESEKAFQWHDVGACASLVVRPDGRIESGGIGFSHFGVGFRLFEGLTPESLSGEPIEIFGASGTAVMFRRSLYLESGGLDPQFFAQDEDIDLAFRFRYAGSRCLLNPLAQVLHIGSATLQRRPDQMLYLAQRNLELVFWLNVPPWAWLIWGPPHMIYQKLSVMRHIIRGRGRPVLRAKWHAARMFFALLRKRGVPKDFSTFILPWIGKHTRSWNPPAEEH